MSLACIKSTKLASPAQHPAVMSLVVGRMSRRHKCSNVGAAHTGLVNSRHDRRVDCCFCDAAGLLL